MPETGKTSFQSVIDNLWETTKLVLKQIAVKELSKSEVIQKEIEAQKTVTGKNVLWRYFPYIVGGLVLVMVLRFKG